MSPVQLKSNRPTATPPFVTAAARKPNILLRPERLLLTALLMAFAIAVSGLFTAAQAQSAPIANNDDLSNLPVGAPAVINVLSNDIGGSGTDAIEPASVRMISPTDMLEIMVWDEPGEGRWQVDAAGTITFTGCEGVDDPFAGICTGPFEGDAFPMEYVVRNKTGTASNPAQIYLSLSNDGGTVPVTIGYVMAERSGASVHFVWQTITETSNAGFNLLGEQAGDVNQINEQLISSTVIDSVEPADYEYWAVTDADSFYIQEVSLGGKTGEIGPFMVGQPYGEYIDHGGASVPPQGVDDLLPKAFLPILIGR